MAVQFKDRWEIQATLVANEFIDTYMAQANGEYVKVYLYLLRHQREEVTVEAIASALDHTESDVKRALAYWKKKVSWKIRKRSGNMKAGQRRERNTARTAQDCMVGRQNMKN